MPIHQLKINSMKQQAFNKKPDVVYFDYWTRGIRHFSSIDPHLRKAGYSTLLVHMGSLRGEPIVNDQVLSGIQCIDLCYFRNNLVNMLLLLRPKIVLLLNNQTEDRIIVRACKNLNIKTVFLMHGILSTTSNKESNASLTDSAFGIRARLKRIPKYYRLLQCYYQAAKLKSMRSFFFSDIILYFVRQFLSPGSNIFGKYSYSDGVADYALVYSQDDQRYFVEAFGWQLSRLIVVGNYNLDPLHIHASRQPSLVNGSNYVVYIENGFSDPKFPISGWSEEAVADEVITMAGILRLYGYSLVLKLHPSSDYHALPKLVSKYEFIKVIADCDLAELISSSTLVIGQSSTVLMMAIAVSKPIIIPDIFPLRLGSSIYADKGLGTVVKTFNDFSSYLESIPPKISSTCIESKAIESFVGPFDGKSTQRIASFLISLI